MQRALQKQMAVAENCICVCLLRTENNKRTDMQYAHALDANAFRILCRAALLEAATRENLAAYVSAYAIGTFYSDICAFIYSESALFKCSQLQ